jgi:hypothetical protein
MPLTRRTANAHAVGDSLSNGGWRDQELAIGIGDELITRPVEDDASARPVFVFVCPHDGVHGWVHSPFAAPMIPCFVVAGP